MNLKRLAVDGILAEYGRVSPAERHSKTPGSAIGVAFTPQRKASWSVGGTNRLGGVIEPSAVFITPAEGLEWEAWDLVSESIEVWLDQQLLSRLSHDHGGPSNVAFDHYDRIHDPIIIDIASRIRRLLCAPTPSLGLLAALARELSEHYLRVYVGVNIGRESRALDGRRLRRVVDYIDAHLGKTISLDQMADVAALSPFHFARAFKAATGSPPHSFVVSRRMDRAAALFRWPGATVAGVAEATGFASRPHFRRHFRENWGIAPGAFRRASEPLT